jgi:acetyl esterase/lipase
VPFPRAVDLLNAAVGLSGVVVTRDIPFGPGPRQRMDVYRPAGAAGPTPVLVFFYGGAWQYGDRADYRFVAASLAQSGVVVAVPDYRLYPEVRFPAFVEDGALAVAQMRQIAAAHGGDPARLFVAGHSAGAYIAAMLAVVPGYLGAVGLARTDLAGAIGLGGPYDFLPIVGADIKLVFASANDDLRRTQPIFHADGGNAPLLLLHGERDLTCYPRNALALAARVRAAGGSAHARIYRRVGHIGIVLGFAPLLRFRAPSLSDTLRFISGRSISGRFDARAWEDGGSLPISRAG